MSIKTSKIKVLSRINNIKNIKKINKVISLKVNLKFHPVTKKSHINMDQERILARINVVKLCEYILNIRFILIFI